MRRPLLCLSSCLTALGLVLVCMVLLGNLSPSRADNPSLGLTVPDSARQRVAFTKEVSTPWADVGQRVTYRLRWVSLDQFCCPLSVVVVDPNPAPMWLKILTPTITGGAWYSPTIDGVVWRGEIVPGEDRAEVTYQVKVLGMPPGTPESGYAIKNRASMVDWDVIGSLPTQMAEATLVLAELERLFLPLMIESQGEEATQTFDEPPVQPQNAVVPALPAIRRNEGVGGPSVWTDADYQVALPLIWNNGCDATGTAKSPFGLEIAALHQIMPVQALNVLGERAWPQAAYSTLVDALEQSGAGWTRVHIAWEELQPKSPAFDAARLAWYDQRLALVAGAGVRIIATVADAPEWAADVPCAPIYAARLDEFAQFLADLVRRYSQPPYNIHHWELINEPDSTWRRPDTNGLGCWADASTDQDGRVYAEMLAVAYEAIKAADSEAMVLMGGLAHDWFTEYGGPFDRSFPDDVMSHGGGRYIDALNFHYFPDFYAEWERWAPEGNPPTCGVVDDGVGTPYEAWGIDLAAKTNHYRNRLSTCYGVDKPVWITELAEHGKAGDLGSLERQARYVIQGYARGLAAGAQNITWYALTTPNDPYEQGLLYADWSPKPAFYAYQAMTAELSGYTYLSTLQVGGGEAYVFNDVCGREKTVAWGSATLLVDSADRVRVVDRWGDEWFVLDGGPRDADGGQNHSITLALSSEPFFVSVDR